MWVELGHWAQSGALLLVGLSLAVVWGALRGLRTDAERRHRERARAANWELRQR